MATSAKYWDALCWLENMREDWESECEDLLQIPFAYCIHNQDLDKKGEDRKPHVHFVLAFKNTTTYNHCLETMQRLSAEGKSCINTVQKSINVRKSYDYLIHDTESAKKKGKHLYPESDRKLCNNFDIGVYEQIDLLDEQMMIKELADYAIQFNFTNFTDFYMYVTSTFEMTYFRIMKNHRAFFEAITRGNYLKEQEMNKRKAQGK